MELSTPVFMSALISAINWWFPELIDLSLKPPDCSPLELSKEYDFIIVGAGSAGCVIANRLSENHNWTVLLIEAGDDETFETDIPLFHFNWRNTKYNWNYTTVPQRRACLAKSGICEYPRSRIMGGSSSINGMMYVRGSKRDYDDWVRLGCESWGYKDVLPFFIKAENVTEPKLSTSRHHGTQGPLHVQYPRYHTSLRNEYVKAGEQLGWINSDYNDGMQQNKIDYNQVTINGAIRESSSKAYLNPIRERKNLTVLKRSFVKKILIDKSKHVATGVEYDNEGITYNVTARKEIIISTGAIHTPQLLMLSGIGPKEELHRHRIDIISDLPVGRFLQDNIFVPLYYKINKNSTISTNTWKSEDAIKNYTMYRNGPLSSTGIETLAFINPQNSRASPRICYLFSSFLNEYENSQNLSIITVFVGLIRSRSYGKLSLKSKNPYDHPLIRPNYLSESSDFDALYKGIEMMHRFMGRTSTMSKYSPKYYTKLIPKCNSYQERFFSCLIEQYSEPFFQPIGTARMGNIRDRRSVVTPKLLVKGFDNLRVVDASVMPYSPRTPSLTAPTIMIAEKISEVIKINHLLVQSEY